MNVSSPSTAGSQRLAFVERVVLLPVTLLLNFSLFQYLAGLYFRRWHEARVALLLLCAFVSFASLVPFADPDELELHRLSDVSELSSILTFLLQITIIGRGINRKMRVRSITFSTYAAELGSLLGIALMFANIVEIAAHSSEDASVLLDDVSEGFKATALVFIVCFRFYYLGMSRGLSMVIRKRKTELFFYALFMTHEYPFLVLRSCYPALPWDAPQALWSRITISLCIGMTLRDKIRNHRERMSAASASSFRSRANSNVNMTEAISAARRKSSAFVANSAATAERIMNAMHVWLLSWSLNSCPVCHSSVCVAHSRKRR